MRFEISAELLQSVASRLVELGEETFLEQEEGKYCLLCNSQQLVVKGVKYHDAVTVDKVTYSCEECGTQFVLRYRLDGIEEIRPLHGLQVFEDHRDGDYYNPEPQVQEPPLELKGSAMQMLGQIVAAVNRLQNKNLNITGLLVLHGAGFEMRGYDTSDRPGTHGRIAGLPVKFVTDTDLTYEQAVVFFSFRGMV
jgi:Zn finger protein HypA/HybF involved in hydrogenase expression